MLCDVCQTRQAKIFYTEIVNGQRKEQHLCEQCASEHTIVPLNDLIGGQGLSSVGSILSGILSSYAKGRNGSIADTRRMETTCPECGTNESEFLKTGRTGCPVCYSVFKDIIVKNFKTMQGGLTHVGKEPLYAKFVEVDDNVSLPERPLKDIKDLDKRMNLPESTAESVSAETEGAAGEKAGKKKAGRKTNAQKAEEKREMLKQALEVEDYELAAKLRDEIKALEVKHEKKKK